MPDEPRHARPELELEELRRQHLGDTPSATERAQLLSLVLEQGNTEKVLEPSLTPPRRVRTLMLMLAALTATAAAMSVWQGTGPGIHPEPAAQTPPATASIGEPAVATSLPLSPKQCAAAQGGAGLLADFEQPFSSDRPLELLPFDHRRGQWFHTVHDRQSDALQAPLLVEKPGSSNSSRGALHVRGTALTGWGANVGLRLESCYDASAYTGVEFRARGPGSVFLAFQTVSSVPVEFGGECRERCWFNGGRFIVLGKDFETYRVRFSDINTPDGQAVEKTLLQVLFSVQSGAAYDFWLDDVKFFTNREK